MMKVLVMLSAYNGERYIQEQVESILKQRDVEVSLLIRDDGSTDATVAKLQAVVKQDERVQLIQGENIGFRRSFYNLLLQAPQQFDYYAFSDQDDVWDPDKLSRAVQFLETCSQSVKLYTSALKVVDSQLNFMYLNSFKGIRISYGSALSRQRLAGCTMVFSRGLLDDCQQFKITPEMGNLFSHDAAVYYICLVCGGKVMFDSESRINFRRHEGTVTEHGKGFLKRVESVVRIFGTARGQKFQQARMLYEVYSEKMPVDILELSKKILGYRNSIKNTIALLTDPRMECGIRSVDLVNKLAILTHCY